MGRVEYLLLEIVEARVARDPDGRVWEFLERLAEEVMLLRAEREQDPILERAPVLH